MLLLERPPSGTRLALVCTGFDPASACNSCLIMVHFLGVPAHANAPSYLWGCKNQSRPFLLRQSHPSCDPIQLNRGINTPNSLCASMTCLFHLELEIFGLIQLTFMMFMRSSCWSPTNERQLKAITSPYKTAAWGADGDDSRCQCKKRRNIERRCEHDGRGRAHPSIIPEEPDSVVDGIR